MVRHTVSLNTVGQLWCKHGASLDTVDQTCSYTEPAWTQWDRHGATKSQSEHSRIVMVQTRSQPRHSAADMLLYRASLDTVGQTWCDTQPVWTQSDSYGANTEPA